MLAMTAACLATAAFLGCLGTAATTRRALAPSRHAVRVAAPTPSATPLPSAATPEAPSATPQPATPDAAPQPAPPTVIPVPSVGAGELRDHLIGPGGLDAAVGIYSDCTGSAPLSFDEAAIDTCVTGRTYFVGHNVGVFTPLMGYAPGAVLTYYDHSGVRYNLRVVSAFNWAHGGMPPDPEGAPWQFQTCVTPDGSLDRLVDAVSV